MIFWLDAQLPPGMAEWITQAFSYEAHPVRDLDLRDAADREIYEQARTADVVIISKDSDFVDLVTRLGPPPRLIWLTCGNVTNARLREVFRSALPETIRLLEAGEPIVQIEG